MYVGQRCDLHVVVLWLEVLTQPLGRVSRILSRDGTRLTLLGNTNLQYELEYRIYFLTQIFIRKTNIVHLEKIHIMFVMIYVAVVIHNLSVGRQIDLHNIQWLSTVKKFMRLWDSFRHQYCSMLPDQRPIYFASMFLILVLEDLALR